MSIVEKLPKVLLRVTSRKKAEAFVNEGLIEFGCPDKWIKYCENNGNNRIGDVLEGVFLKKSVLEKQHVYNKNSIIAKTHNGYICYWNKTSLNMPTLCFYGIGKNNITNFGIKTLYHTQDIGYVDTSYFKDFVNNSPYIKEEHKKVKKDNQKVVIIIYEPARLVQLIKEKTGCRVFCSNIDYVDKTKKFNANCQPPFELFYKDLSYKEQSEFRIILDNQNISCIRLGNLSSFCRVEEMYFYRMDFAFQENNTFLYKLPETKTENYYEKGFEELCTLFLVLAELDYPVQRKRIEDYYYLVNQAKPHFLKYGIEPYIDINLKTNSFNIKYTFKDEKWKEEFYKISNDLHNLNDKHFHEIAVIK